MQLAVCPQCCAVASSWRYRSSDPSGNKQVIFAFSVDMWDRETEGIIYLLWWCLQIAADLCLSERCLFPVASANTTADICALQPLLHHVQFYQQYCAFTHSLSYDKLMKCNLCIEIKYLFDIPRWLTLTQSPCKLFISKVPCGVSDL